MYILADIGGTKTRVAGSFDLASLGEPIILDTPEKYGEGLKMLTDAALKASNGVAIKGMVAGIKSVVSKDKRMPLTAPQMMFLDWKGKSLAEDLEKILHAPVLLENDTALVGLGEAVFGAGINNSIVAYVTVSTGVNGVRIVDGRIDRSRDGFEIGGQYLSMSPMHTLENLVSGTAITERFGMHPKDLGKDNAIWEEVAKTLAVGIHNTILHWSPDCIVLGGSMMNEIGIPVDRISFHTKSIMQKFPDVPPILHSSLKDVGGLWGGMAYLKAQAEVR